MSDSLTSKRVNERPVYQERSREKRDRLVKAGFRIFARDGYQGARIADIAKAAGISVGSFYHRFGDKRGFFEILIEEYTLRGQSNWEIFFATADPNWSIQELCERLVAGDGRAVDRNMGLFSAYVSLGREDESVVEPFRRMDLTGARLFLEALQKRKDKGFEKLDLETVHFALSSIGKTLAFSAIVKGSTYNPQDPHSIRQLAKMLQRYLQLN